MSGTSLNYHHDFGISHGCNALESSRNVSGGTNSNSFWLCFAYGAVNCEDSVLRWAVSESHPYFRAVVRCDSPALLCDAFKSITWAAERKWKKHCGVGELCRTAGEGLF